MFEIMEFLFPILFVLIFITVISAFLTTLVKTWQTEHKNNHSPRLTVEATVVGKRGSTTRHRHTGAGNHTYHTYNDTYFATFQFESGDRLELELQGSQFGLLVEGDKGKLTFQGTRFLDFQRQF